MKRLRVILLFLLLGAVVNIAVAWGCAIYAYINMFVETDHGNTSDPGFSSDTGACWLFTRADFFGSTLLNGRAIIEADRKDTHLWLVEYYSPLGEVPPIPAWSQFAEPPTLYKSLFEESEGLPFRTLFWLEAYNEWPTKYITYDGRKHVWAVRVYSNDVNLPLAPIWIGLLLNTIFYASLLCSCSPARLFFASSSVASAASA